MTTFKLIIKNIIKTENNIFSSNYDKTDEVNLLYKLLYQNLLNENINPEQKFIFLNNSLQNIFLNDKDVFMYYFCKIQQTYNALNRFAFLYKYNKSKIVVDTDMTLNKITENQKNVLCIFHKNAKYLFTANDMINIINTSLINNYEFFAEPLCIKNPYNNLPFTKSILYNIYLFIKYNTYLKPELLFHFFSCNFNLSLFKKKYEYVLREHAIVNYVYKSPSTILIRSINIMIKEFNTNCAKLNKSNRIIIDKDFPKEKLIKIMKPYLLVFFTSNYSLLFYKKAEARIYLKNLLVRFNNFNPQFGRKKIKIIMTRDANFKKKIAGKIIEFDEMHVGFNNNKKDNAHFLDDHINYVENSYYYNNILLIDNIDNGILNNVNETNDSESDENDSVTTVDDELDSVS